MPQPQPEILPLADTASGDFELLYLAVRGLEQRIYSDKQLRALPEIEPGHIHYKEWVLRKRSSEKLVKYLSKKNKQLNILEIGCGNGWLANKLAEINGATVFALDVNKVEIDQAQRVFKKRNLQFFNGGFDDRQFMAVKFDVVVFAASIQYFSPLGEMLQKVMRNLAADGEIHIIDSNFYSPFTVDAAVERTQEYYSNMRFPEMAAFYFHHRLDELREFNYKILANPGGLINKLLKGGPFYWICIKKDKA